MKINKYDGGPYKIMCRPGSYLIIKEVEGLDYNYNSVSKYGNCPDLNNTVMSECSGRQQCILFFSMYEISSSTCPDLVYLKITCGCISIKEMAIRGFAPRPNKKYFTQTKKNYKKYFSKRSKNSKFNSNGVKWPKKYLNNKFDKNNTDKFYLKVLKNLNNKLKKRDDSFIIDSLLKKNGKKENFDKMDKNDSGNKKSIIKKNNGYLKDNFLNQKLVILEKRSSVTSAYYDFPLRTLNCLNNNCTVSLTSILNSQLQNILMIAKSQLLKNYKISYNDNESTAICTNLNKFTNVDFHKNWNICTILSKSENLIKMIKENSFVLVKDSKSFLIQLDEDISELYYKHLNNDVVNKINMNITNPIILVAEKRTKETCKSDFCSNNGFCFLTPIGSRVCICRYGFGGLNCENQHDACSSQPCMHGGSCYSIEKDKFKCGCTKEYDGIYCHHTKRKCEEVTCFNGGVCRQSKLLTGFTCLCPTGFGGLYCELIDPCLNLPCQNGAMCKLNKNASTYTCLCPAGFSGMNCEIANPRILIDLNDACSDVPCQNNGVCQVTSMAPGFICICPNGVKGKLCETDLKDECLSNPCRNNGVCLNLAGSFKCKCTLGYSGVTCEVKEFKDLCDSNPCKNDGKCRLINKSNYECICRAIYSGENCDIRDQPCLYSDKCPKNRKCIEMPSSFINSHLCVDITNEPAKNFKWAFIDTKKIFPRNSTSYIVYRHIEPFSILGISFMVLIGLILLSALIFLFLVYKGKEIDSNNSNNITRKPIKKSRKLKKNLKKSAFESSEDDLFNQEEYRKLIKNVRTNKKINIKNKNIKNTPEIVSNPVIGNSDEFIVQTSISHSSNSSLESNDDCNTNSNCKNYMNEKPFINLDLESNQQSTSNDVINDGIHLTSNLNGNIES